MGQKLTERSIEKLACSAGKRDRMLFDGEQRGLAVRVMAAGSKSYVAQYTVRGRKRRVPLGSSDAISLAAARDATRVILGQVAQGRDPAAERTAATAAAKAEAARQRTTVASLVGDWERLHLANLSANYAQEAPRALKKALTDAGWWERPAERLQREDVIALLDDQGAAIARSVAAYGSACFGWSLRRGQVACNPFARPPIAMGTTRRDRVLSDEELARVWRAACEAPEPYGSIVRMVTLTAQRKDEARRFAWAELSQDSKTWTIPGTRTKNDNPNLVPLCAAVRDLIGPPPKVRRGLVFPGQGGKPFGGFSKAKSALDEASGVTGWRLHDLRRTAASGLQRLGTPLQVTEAILNHASGSRSGIVGIYQLYEYQAEKAVALEAWAAHVVEISAPTQAHREGGGASRGTQR